MKIINMFIQKEIVDLDSYSFNQGPTQGCVSN